MGDLIKTLLDSIYKLLDQREKIEDEYFNFFVKNIYENTKNIYSDYYKILKHIEKEIRYKRMEIADAVEYLDDSRLPFKSARTQVRGVIKHPYYHRNEDLAWFAIGVIGVLEGGLHDSTERELYSKVPESAIILSDKLTIKGNHTIVDIIKKYDKNDKNSLYYSERYKNYNHSELNEKMRALLLNDISKQISKMDKSWQLVCDYYPKLVL